MCIENLFCRCRAENPWGKSMKKEDYRVELRKEHEHWKELFCQGGQDPFWPDGVNLNLVRNHIIACRTALEQEGKTMPEEYGWPLPPEVSPDYMARGKEIWYQGIESYKKYIADENYQYLKEISGTLPEKVEKESSIINVLGYVQSVRTALEQGDYVTLRLHENPERYLESFAECREHIGKLLIAEQELEEGTVPKAERLEDAGQMNLFQMGLGHSR